MTANVRSYTPNYAFKLINFDTPRWHTLEYANWTLLDALLTQGGIAKVRGEWLNSTTYIVGDRVIDTDQNSVYRALVEHTSAASGTFEEDREARPDIWVAQIDGVPVYRGEWMSNETYALGDIVHSTPYLYHLCTTPNVSGSDFDADSQYWQVVFDCTQATLDAQTAADEAAQSATDSANSAADSAVSADESATSAADAIAAADASASAQGAFRWTFSSSNVIADPGASHIRFNSLSLTAVTHIAISSYTADQGTPDVSEWVATWDDSTNPAIKGSVYVRVVGAPENFAVFNITGNVSDLGTWLDVIVTNIAFGGLIPNGSDLYVAFSRAGNQGAAGPGGGDMFSGNNLLDVASITTSIDNLGLGPTSTPAFAQVVLGNAPSIDTHAATKLYVDSILSGTSDSLKTYIDTGDLAAGPAGAVQFKSGSVAGGDAGLVWDNTNKWLRVHSTDNAASCVFSGVSKGVRIGCNSFGSNIDGVDASGVGSYQPLTLNASQVQLVAGASALTVQPGNVHSSVQVDVGSGVTAQAYVARHPSANSLIYVDCPTGLQSFIQFMDNGTNHWFEGKHVDNSYMIWDPIRGYSPFTITHNGDTYIGSIAGFVHVNGGAGLLVDGANVNVPNGQVHVGAATYGGNTIELGDGTNYCFIDFHAQVGSDYDARILRAPGANAAFLISNLGGGVLSFDAVGGAVPAFQIHPAGHSSLAAGVCLNWGSINGVFGLSGYGLYDNGGTLQLKHSWSSNWAQIMTTGHGAVITCGYSVTTPTNGTPVGTLTPSPYISNYQHINNAGPFTVAAPSVDCAIDILIYNQATAGAITMSGFTAPPGGGGDAFVTTPGTMFILMIRRLYGIATYCYKALQ